MSFRSHHLHVIGNEEVKRLQTDLIACLQEQKMSDLIRVKVRLAEGTDTYVIRDVDSDDEGRYFCRVTNTFGMKEVHVDVRMLG
jgi:Immunoglobulin I-set domain